MSAATVVKVVPRTRTAESWLLGGVAAELAERVGVPVAFVRGLWFVSAFGQPAVGYAYMLAALLLPRAESRRPDWVNLIAFARVGLALGLVWSLNAGGLGLDHGLFDEGPGVWVTQYGVCLAGLLALAATGAAASERDRAHDRRLVLTATPLVVAAGLIAAGVVLVPEVRWERVLAAVALAGGVAVAAGYGRPWGSGLVVMAAALAAATLFLAVAGVRLDGGTGAQRNTPVDAVAPVYRRAIGELSVDLRGLRARPGVVTVRASVGLGGLTVEVPVDAEVSAVEHVGRGLLSVRGPQREGHDLRRTVVAPAEDPQTGRPLARPRLRLVIVAEVGVGHLEVRRDGSFEGGAL